ncbi:unnamed protein product [Urochloa humidicola]
MASIIGWALLLCLVQLHPLVTSSAHADGNSTHHHSTPSSCRPDQANALLKLKQSFMFHIYSPFEFDFPDSITTLPSWQAGTDCCLWEGVGCSNSSGHVTVLNLGGFGLYSNGIDPVLFNLTSLRLLDLSMNNFGGLEYSKLPPVGFERLALLTHLNLSNSGIIGQVPIGISKLTNLVSLDLSSRRFFPDDSYTVYGTSSGSLNALSVSRPNFQTLVANLSNLKELYLDHVIISSPHTAEDWFRALSKSVPHLQVLSLEGCGLQGHIDRISRLHSLAVINLSHNDGITPGPFPEFFMNFLNLRVLQLSGINLEGSFPRAMFQSKNLRVLELSENPNLSGHIPRFSDATSLETLMVDGTNFSYVRSSYFSNFTALTELGLDGKVISGDFLSSFGMVPSMRKLILTGLNLPSELESVFSWFEGIKNLRTLRFEYCDLSMTIPSSIGKFKSLTSLVIFNSNITTQTLSAVASISNLKVFAVNSCDCLLGKLPSAIGNMTSLEELSIDCHLSGSIPHEIGAVKKLISLVLPFNGLSGRIPNSIGNLTQLTELQLSENYLRGEIPTSLFSIPELQYLDLSGNELSGPIHEFHGESSRLKIVDLSANELTGLIPQSLLVLPNLTCLDVGENNMMGSVDLASSLWRLENLTILNLSHNKLTVTEGEGSNFSSTYPSRLLELGLAGCNMTKIPKLLMRLNHLAYLDLSSNRISGEIPNWIWETQSDDLKALNLSHNLFTGTELNSYVIPFRSFLDVLDLSSNRLKGHIPMPSSSAFTLDYSNNMFSSLLPNFTLYLNSTTYLKLSNNNISGHLPHSICNSPLYFLDLSYNNFSGPLPPCLMETRYLNVLKLRENQFKGLLPSNISSTCDVETIDLHGNKIEGQLPRALHNCTNLVVLDLGRNQIGDTFPSWLGRLLNLRVLVLRSNHFHGSIGYLEDEKSGEQFSSLQIIDLASNNFSGNLHPQWFGILKSMKKYNNTGQIIYHRRIGQTGQFYQDSVTISYKGSLMTFDRILTTFTAIDISDNALEGSIPVSIGNLISLHVLNMSHNAFSGEIPPQLGSITALESLDLSSNMLSGEIPQELTNLSFLSVLNLSNNRLDGRIPQSPQFTTFQNSSFDGNAGLCGPPLTKQCGTTDTESKANLESSSDNVDVILFVLIGVGFGVGFAAAILLKQDWISKWFHTLKIL